MDLLTLFSREVLSFSLSFFLKEEDVCGSQTTFRRLFFSFFFSKTKSFASKTSEKRKCPPVSYIHTYFLSRVFLPPTLFFSFLAAAGASQGRSLPFLFCFFFTQKNEGETFLVPAEKKRLEETKEQKQKTNLPRARFERSRSDRIV